MRLDGPQIGALTQILVTAFSRGELTILVRVKLNIDLATEVSTDDAWREVAYHLIDTLDRKEQAIDLIRAIREERPRDTTLIAFCDPLLAQTNGAAQPASPVALSKAVAAFNNVFEERNEYFKYLNAYKALHDVLHEIQSFHPKIATAVANRKSDPSQPLADDVAWFLEEQVRVASENVKDTEFPERPPAWLARLVTAEEVINGTDLEKMPRQVERLKTLPSEGLGPLNDKLFESASHLQPMQLVNSLSDILTALGPVGNPAMAKLRGELEDFRGLCSELGELIKAHNLCQRIDDALRVPEGLPSVTPEEVSDWDVAKKSLDELALQRKNDKNVQRTNEAAKFFEAANQGQEFQTLIERFDDLFMNTDKALLRVTNKLPQKAMALHTALVKIQ